MSAELKSLIKFLADSASPKAPEPHFSRPQPSGEIPAELLPDRYIATKPHSYKATEHDSSGWGWGDMTRFLPATKEKHSSVHEGLDNCLWRLCRRIRAMSDHSPNETAVDADGIFELWHVAYLDWCKAVSVGPEPKSRLHGEFLVASEKCKLAEGQNLVAYAFDTAKEKPFPPETASFADDNGMCMLASTLRECALFNDEGGLCYASTRDIEKYTELCTKDTAGRWLRQLERRKVLMRIFEGRVSATTGIAPWFIYLPLADVDRMSPRVRALYENAISKQLLRATEKSGK